MTPNLRTPSEARRSRPRRPKAAASTGGTGSAGKPAVRRPKLNRWGALGGISNARPIVLASLRAIEHASRYPPRRRDLRQSGGGGHWPSKAVPAQAGTDLILMHTAHPEARHLAAS